MKYRLLAFLITAWAWVGTPAIALAADDENQSPIDARLQGYQSGNAALNNASGSALMWLLLFVLAAICLGVLFMNPKRSHLD